MYLTTLIGPILPFDLYQWHQFIWQFFENTEDQKRDFLFRLDISENKAFIIVKSRRRPVYTFEGWFARTEVYEPQWSQGQKVSFQVHLNPAIWVPRDNGKGWMRTSLIKSRLGHSSATNQQIRGLLTHWFAQRATSFGFILDQMPLTIQGYDELKFRKKGRQIILETVEIAGRLVITDLERFNQSMNEGIGKARSFACGMLLAQPVYAMGPLETTLSLQRDKGPLPESNQKAGTATIRPQVLISQ